MYLHNYNANTDGMTNGNKKLTAKKLITETSEALKNVGSTFMSNKNMTPQSGCLNHVYMSLKRAYAKGNKAPEFKDYIEDITVACRGRNMYIPFEDLDEMVGALIHVRDELRTLRDIHEAKAKNLATAEEVEEDDNNDDDDDDDDYDY